VQGEGMHVLGILHGGDVFPSVVPIDTTSPTITFATPPGGVTYQAGQVVKASYQCDDGGSGVASCTGSVPSGANVPTNVVGDRTFTVTAKDFAGHTTTVTHNYRVVYSFDGFFAPVDNLPFVNLVSGGASVPMRFSLGGDFGLNVLAAGSPSSVALTCVTGAPIDPIEDTTTTNTSGLVFQTTNNQYVYTWKTDKKWAGTCRQFVLKLTDGTSHVANFKFK
jgi:hypothetical protein